MTTANQTEHSTRDEDAAAEGRRLNAEEREEREAPPFDCGGCRERVWHFKGRTVYGDDADGNRGIPLEAWECGNCGAEIEVTG